MGGGREIGRENERSMGDGERGRGEVAHGKESAGRKGGRRGERGKRCEMSAWGEVRGERVGKREEG